MAKRKITVTVDEALVEAVHALGAESLSGVVNAALAQEVERRARSAALAHMLAEWDEAFGPVDEQAMGAAVAAFDDIDAVAPAGDPPSPRRRRRGAA